MQTTSTSTNARMGAMSMSSSGRLGAALAAAALTFLVSLIFWPLDLSSDQALFASTAHRLLNGAVLYRDIWDNKQPGIYAFYAAAEALFGPGWPGLRLAFSLWSAASAALVTMLVSDERSGVSPGVAMIATALTPMTALLLRLDSDHVAQIEELMPLLLLAIYACASRRAAGGSSRLAWNFVAGALIFLVGFFKLILLPLPGLVYLTALAMRRGSESRDMRRPLIAELGGATAGFLAGMLATWMWFSAQGTFGLLIWTTFEYPFSALTDVAPAPAGRLVRSAMWFTLTVTPILPLAWFGLQGLRRFPAPESRMPLVFVVWIGVAALLIAAQKFSLWSYHFGLLVWPLGLLACLGFVGRRAQSPRPRIDWAIAWLVVTLIGQAGYTTFKLVAKREYTIRTEYVAALANAERLSRSIGDRCGSVYVFGTPAYMTATGRRQAIPTQGGNWETTLPAQRQRLAAELSEAAPDMVYASIGERAFIRSRLTDVAQWLEREYDEQPTDSDGGTWWIRRASPPPAQCPAPKPFAIPGR